MLDLHSSSDIKLLPLIFLLTCPGVTSADETGFISVSEGDDAVLPCSLSSKQNIEKMVFDWKKDQREVFLYDKGQHYNNGRAGQDKQFEGRVSHFEDELKFGNASIRIRRTQLSDNGSYTCTFPDTQKSHIMLYVDPDPEQFVLKDRTDENIQEIPTGWIIGVVVPCALLLLVMVAGIVLVLLFAKGHLIVKLKPGQISNLESEHLNCSSSSGKITHQNP